jgi:hypothetical protein
MLLVLLRLLKLLLLLLLLLIFPLVLALVLPVLLMLLLPALLTVESEECFRDAMNVSFPCLDLTAADFAEEAVAAAVWLDLELGYLWRF